MARDDKIIDWRSTGRRKARRTLFREREEFKCCDCSKTVTEPPQDAPNYFDELWPEENRTLTPRSLQADHTDKDVTNNSIENLCWRCASCHKLADMQTEKGVGQNEDSYLEFF